jgi:hypothetical protein
MCRANLDPCKRQEPPANNEAAGKTQSSCAEAKKNRASSTASVDFLLAPLQQERKDFLEGKRAMIEQDKESYNTFMGLEFYLAVCILLRKRRRWHD